MANGRRSPHPLLRTRIVELYEALNEQNRPADLADVKRIAWILGELDKAGMFDQPSPLNGSPGLMGKLADQIGIHPMALWITAVLLAVWAGPNFWSVLASVVKLFG